jgi:hypothetical protein
MSTAALIFAILGSLVALIILGLEPLRRASPVNPTGTGAGTPMNALDRSLLFLCLSLIGIATLLQLFRLVSMEFPSPPTAPDYQAQNVSAEIASSLKAENPTLYVVQPLSPIDNPGVGRLLLQGSHFDTNTAVRINNQTSPSTLVDSTLLIVSPPKPLLIASNPLIVAVIKDGKSTNGITIPLRTSSDILTMFAWVLPVNREGQIFLLAILAGNLGGLLHAIGSLAAFTGNKTLLREWTLWYISRPFVGASIALVFLAIVRAGILTVSTSDGMALSPYTAISIGTLVGMFSDDAILKLSEVFVAFFKIKDDRAGKLKSDDSSTLPFIDKIDPAIVPVNQPATLNIRGLRLGTAKSVRINETVLIPTNVQETSVTVKIEPKGVQIPGRSPVIVTNREGSPSNVAWLQISDLAITTSALQAGTVNAPVSQQLGVVGGIAPYAFTLKNAPEWLKIDQASGVLSGTPTVAETVAFDVEVRDANSFAVTKHFTLDIQKQG